uniref:craniofacial development protein 2-like n=1 Tax=Erigeron canadensis TaxID=72917 RepID=UPI001CB96C2A|nr:craniofacial development protein 2-like [Erigeron canadensis]
MNRCKVDIVCLQETRWIGGNIGEEYGYKLWYFGAPSGRNGVGIIMTERLKDYVVHVERHGDRLMLVRLVIQEETINVISAYAPQSGRGAVEKTTFWDSLNELVRSCPDDQRLVLGGDLNGHIGVEAASYSGVHEGLGFGKRNDDGRMILEFATAHDLAIANSFFRKRRSQLITFQSARLETQIDYFLVRKGDFRACKDCKVLHREGCISQHRLLVLDLLVSIQVIKLVKAVKPRILWKNLMGEAAETFRSTTSTRFARETQDVSHMVVVTSRTFN